MEQFELGFDTPEPEKEQSLEELSLAYKKAIGVSPRTNDREALLSALADPETEIDRLRAEDTEDDKTEVRKTYRGS